MPAIEAHHLNGNDKSGDPSQMLLQVVRLERRGVTFTVAVFTDGQPTPEYGATTIREVAWLLLASDPRSAP